MSIHYTSDRITSVTDGAGRTFTFAYNADDGCLTSITAPDGTAVTYSYTGSYLTGICYPGGQKVEIAYQTSKPSQILLKDANDHPVYKVGYTFTGDHVSEVSEYGVSNGDFTPGVCSVYDYSAAAKRTVVETREPMDTELGETESTVVKTVYAFDSEGNTISEYIYTEETGNIGIQGEGSGIHPHSGDSGQVISNINNLLRNHSFDGLVGWTGETENAEDLNVFSTLKDNDSKFGRRVLQLRSCHADATANGVYQESIELPQGKYTFSAYLRIVTENAVNENIGAYIRVTKTDGTVLTESEHLTQYDTEFIRLIVPFELQTAERVRVHILLDGKGTLYADGAQLENNPYANAYNLLVNGNFEHQTDNWMKTDSVSAVDSTCFNMKHSLKIEGDMDCVRTACQEVAVKIGRGTRETFTLSGWAKGNGV